MQKRNPGRWEVKNFVCKMNELRLRRPGKFRVDGKPVCVVRLDSCVAAFEPFCPHARADLTHARYDGDIVCCHWHGWKFDLTTGEGVNNDERLKMFPVLIEEGSVYIELEEEKEDQPDPIDFMPEIRWKNETDD